MFKPAGLKFSLIIFCLFIWIFMSGFSPFNWKEEAYKELKVTILKQVSDLLGREITAGNFKGILFYQMIFEDVKLANHKKVKDGTFATADKIVINYNPIKLGLHSNEPLKAIDSIIIHGLRGEIVRNKNGQLNIAELAPPADNQPDKFEPLFTGNIYLVDCPITYKDYIGFSGNKMSTPFQAKVSLQNGSLNFNSAGKVFIKFKSTLETNKHIVNFTGQGFSNLSDGKFDLSFSGKNILLEDWANYAANIPNLEIKSGLVNLDVKINNIKKDFSANGKLSLVKTNLSFLGYPLHDVNGDIFLTENQITFNNIKMYYFNLPALLNGSIADFAKPNLNINLSSQNTNLQLLSNAFPEFKGIDLDGTGNLNIAIKGSLDKIKANGKLELTKASIQGQKLNGDLLINYQNQKLVLSTSQINIYNGLIKGNIEMNLASNKMDLLGGFVLNNIDINKLSQQSPGIEGKLNGDFILNGNSNDFQGTFSGNLSQASIFGQALEQISVKFSYKEGNIALQKFNLSSDQAQFNSYGVVTKDLHFNLITQSQGLLLKGNNFMGNLQAKVDSFNGKLIFTLDNNFLNRPLKYINASGDVALSNLEIGQQKIESAQGEITINEGNVKINNIILKQNQSIININGITGLGEQTNLNIYGKNVLLGDLKILNYLLPEDFKDPGGQANIDINISGQLPENSTIDSIQPLLGLYLNGKIIIINGRLGSLNINEFSGNLQWQKPILTINAAKLITPNSNLFLDGIINDKYIKNFSLSGKIDLNEFKMLTREFGSISGEANIKCSAQGDFDNPNIDLELFAKNLNINYISLNEIKGRLNYQQHILLFPQPIEIKQDQDQYSLSGYIDFNQLMKNHPEKTEINLSFNIKTGNFATIFNLSQMAKAESEFRVENLSSPSGPISKIYLNTLKIPSPLKYSYKEKLILYQENPTKQIKNTGLLDTFGAATKPIEKKKIEKPSLIKNASGKVSGKILLRGTIEKLKSSAQISVANGSYEDFKFDRLIIAGSLEGNQIELGQTMLEKTGGKISASGIINMGKDVKIDIISKNFPVDLLNLLYKDAKFEGRFNGQAQISGQLDKPKAQASINTNKIKIGPSSFDSTIINITLNNNILSLNKIELLSGKEKSIINGELSLSPTGPINISARFYRNAFGLINLMNNQVQWLKGNTSGELTISGTRAKPNINGQIDIKKSYFYIKSIDSIFDQVDSQLTCTNNQVNLIGLSAHWKNKKSDEQDNNIKLSGTMDLAEITKDIPKVSLKLDLNDTDLTINFDKLFKGDVSLNNLSLAGSFYLNEKKSTKAGPNLSGTISLKDGIIYIPGENKEKKALPYLGYNLTLNFLRNIYVEGGDANSLDPMKNIFINLQIESDALKVTGNSNLPSLFGKVIFKRGTVSLMGRELSLLSTANQKLYFPYEPDKVKENIATFSGGEGPDAIIPDLQLNALIKVEDYIEDEENNTTTKQDVIIIADVTGKPFVKEETHSLKIGFSAFLEDRTQKPTKIMPASYTDQEIRVLLLPDYLKSPLGLSKKGAGDVDTNEVLIDYLDARLDSVVLRGLERNLEKSLGLESLTLEYNFGRELRRSFSGSNGTSDEEEQVYGVGFVKGVTDRFFIDIRYSEYSTTISNTNRSEFNYQLTYKLSKIWSISYFMEPDSFYGLADLSSLTTGYYKVTLNAGYSF